jgi:predicted dehydrogenase
VRTPVNIAVVGDPDRAAVLVDALEHLPQAEVRWVCSERRAGETSPLRRGVRQTRHLDDALEDERVDAVMIVATGSARAELVSSAIEADKHVYVCGIPAENAIQGVNLLRNARRRGRCLFSADTARFDPAADRLGELVRSGALGEVLYVHAERRAPTDAQAPVWSQVSDELALALRVLRDEPMSVAAWAESYVDDSVADLLDIRLTFATGIVARLALTALDARIGSTFTVVGTSATAVLQDGKLAVHSRDGSVLYPPLAGHDPLRAACEAFLAAVRSLDGAVQDAEAVTVVEVLEHVQRALRRGGAVDLAQPRPEPELRVVGFPSARG